MAVLVVALAGQTLSAQRVEIAPFASYTFSDGVKFNPRTLVVNPLDTNGTVIDELVPQSGFSHGVQVDFMADSAVAVGFQYSNQFSKLQVGPETLVVNPLAGPSRRTTLTDMNVRNYHGMMTFNLADEEVIPYLFLGLGATQYSFDDFMGNSIEGNTRFSSTWGGGVKIMASEHVGFRFTARWTPTYINSDATGIWCSSYYGGGCWVVGNANYSNQFELGGGLVFRF